MTPYGRTGLARLTLTTLATLAALSVAPRARAEDVPTADSAAEARSQYQLGTQAFHAKRYTEAATHFESAAAYKANAVALFTAGLAWDLASKLERAADAYARALEVPGLDPKQQATAKERVAVLEKTLGTLTVTGPEGWKVQLGSFTEVPVPARLHGAAGVHVLSVRAPGKPGERRDVTLEVGKVSALEVKDEPKPAPPKEEPAPPPAPPPVVVQGPPREGFWITRRAVGVGVAGVGVAALGSAIVLGLSANGARDAYVAGPTRASFDHASSLETWTNVMLVAGGLLAAGGVALVVWPDDPGRERRAQQAKLHVAPTAGGAVLGGTF